ncbi:hypothetical protein BDW22DRAFT_329587 [Trametopsis cervina]|nr:hypothetical protein BDW22DRAFT_329587 [Trametopsis cervina]
MRWRWLSSRSGKADASFKCRVGSLSQIKPLRRGGRCEVMRPANISTAIFSAILTRLRRGGQSRQTKATNHHLSAVSSSRCLVDEAGLLLPLKCIRSAPTFGPRIVEQLTILFIDRTSSRHPIRYRTHVLDSIYPIRRVIDCWREWIPMRNFPPRPSAPLPFGIYSIVTVILIHGLQTDFSIQRSPSDGGRAAGLRCSRS